MNPWPKRVVKEGKRIIRSSFCHSRPHGSQGYVDHETHLMPELLLFLMYTFLSPVGLGNLLSIVFWMYLQDEDAYFDGFHTCLFCVLFFFFFFRLYLLTVQGLEVRFSRVD